MGYGSWVMRKHPQFEPIALTHYPLPITHNGLR